MASPGDQVDQQLSPNPPSQQPSQETNKPIGLSQQADSPAQSTTPSQVGSQSRQDGSSVSDVSCASNENKPATQGRSTTPPSSSSSGRRRTLKLPLLGSLGDKWRSFREYVAPRDSLLRVLRRYCIVHIFPICVICVLLGFNIRGYYIGHSLPGPTGWQDESNIDMLQIAAKIHEISIIASLTTVACDIVCHVLSSKYGVPIDAVDAGTAFSGGTYLL